MQFDSARATRVYGDSRASWYCNGQYFDGELNPISHEEAALPALVEEVAPEVVSTETPSYETIKAPPKPPEVDCVGLQEAPIERTSKTDATYGENRLLKLKALNGSALAAMVMRAGGTPATGYGAKKKNIDWILERVPE